jgi:hypothetical protein
MVVVRYSEIISAKGVTGSYKTIARNAMLSISQR